MVSHRPGDRDGFTLIELLIVIAIIGIIAAMLIPNLLDAMQKAKQKRTVADIHIVGTAMMSWLTDQGSAAAAGASTTSSAVDLGNFPATTVQILQTELAPNYVGQMPALDGWKHNYDYYLNIATPTAEHVMAIRSRGRDGLATGNIYTPSSFDPTDYDQDIVWTDGFFVRWPGK